MSCFDCIFVVMMENLIHHNLNALLIDWGTKRLKFAVFLEGIEIIAILEFSRSDDCIIRFRSGNEEFIQSMLEVFGIVLLRILVISIGEVDVWEIRREDLIEDQFSNCGEKIGIVLFFSKSCLLEGTARDIDSGSQREFSILIGKNCRLRIGEDLSFELLIGTEFLSHGRLIALLIIFGIHLIHVDVVFQGQIVVSENHILGRNTDRLAITRLEDVSVGHHKTHGFGLSLSSKRNMNSHLVTVEVGVEARADKRMETDCLAFDENRLEGLDTQTVKRWGTVEKDRMILGNLFDCVIDSRISLGDQFIGLSLRGDRGILGEDQFVSDEWTEKLDSHFSWQTAFVHIEGRSNSNDGTTGIIDTLTQKVLTETSLLTLQSGGKRLQGISGDGLGWLISLIVIDQGIDRFLKHTFFVDEDDVWCVFFDFMLQTVVLDDDLTIEIVEVGGGITSTIELHHRTKIRWNDRKDSENHPFRLDLRILEGFKNFQSLDRLDSLLVLLSDRVLQVSRNFLDFLVEIDFLEKLQDSFSTDSEFSAGIFVDELGDSEEIEWIRSLGDCLNIILALGIIQITIMKTFAGEDFLFDDHGKDITGRFLIEDLTVFQNLGNTGIGHDMRNEIDNFFKLLGRNAQSKAHLGRASLGIPNMGARKSKVDITHSLTADGFESDLNAALFADFSSIGRFLVSSAMTFIILGRTKDFFAEETIGFRFLGTIVDRFRFGDFTLAPFANLIRTSKTNLDCL